MAIGSTADVLRSSAHAAGWVALIWGWCLAAALLVNHYSRIPMADLLRDPVAVLGASPFTGLLSNLGILAWSAAASTSLFAAAVGRRHARGAACRRYLWVFGLFTLVLMLDDLFLLHEWISAWFVPQSLVPGAYGVLALLLLVRFRATVRTTDYPLLIVALCSFALSAVIDATLDALRAPPAAAGVAEDLVKLLGIVSWAVYFVRTGAAFVADHTDPRGTT